jgi:hypothetical protein
VPATPFAVPGEGCWHTAGRSARKPVRLLADAVASSTGTGGEEARHHITVVSQTAAFIRWPVQTAPRRDVPSANNG